MTDRIQMLLDMHQESPEDTFVLFALGKEHQSQKDWKQALHFYQLLIQTDEEYVGVYYHLGKLYEAQSQLEKAINTYKKGIEIATKVGDLHAKSELAGACMSIDEDFE